MALLAHLLDGFRDKPENVATAALTHVLRTYPMLRQAFIQLVQVPGARLQDVHMIAAQLGANSLRPDVVGTSLQGERLLIMELKFGAGFTEGQPHEYLTSLEYGGELVIIVPGPRASAVWQEACLRCKHLIS